MGAIIRVVHGTFERSAVDELFRSSSADLAPEDMGAIVEFQGVVRRSSPGRTVVAMTYDGYAPLIVRTLGEIVAEVRAQFGVALACAILVRLGRLDVGEASLVIRTGSAHRPPAYGANVAILEALKARAPIWKCEHTAEGESVWLEGCCLRSDHGHSSHESHGSAHAHEHAHAK